MAKLSTPSGTLLSGQAVTPASAAENDVGSQESRPTAGSALALGPRQRSAIISWAAFTVTFVGVRALTYAMKNDIGPFGSIQARGVHLHHYLWGIKLLAASGGLAVHGGDRFRDSAVVASGYGAGAALVIDEFALLVHLKDVYWTKRGRLSLLLGAGLIGAVGASFALIPAWRRHLDRRQQADG